MGSARPEPSGAATIAWFASLGTLGVILLNFLCALAGASWCAPLVGPLALADVPFASGGRLSRCLLLGDCVPGALGEFGIADVACLAPILIGVGVVAAGARSRRRDAAAGAEREPGAGAAVWWLWLGGAGIGLTLAGAVGTALEAAGVWTHLAVSSNPLAEQGASVWVPWLMAASLVVAASFVLRRVAPGCVHTCAADRAVSCLVAALAVWVAAMMVHVSLPAPVQGRYFGLPGIVVGRSQNYEYGTYLGMMAPSAAGLCCLTLLVMGTRRRRSRLSR